MMRVFRVARSCQLKSNINPITNQQSSCQKLLLLSQRFNGTSNLTGRGLSINKNFQPSQSSRTIVNRQAFFSLSSTPSVSRTPLRVRFINFTKLTAIVVGLVTSLIYLSDTRSSIHSWLGLKLIDLLSQEDPEKAHKIAIKILKFIGKNNLIRDRVEDSEQLGFELWGKKFQNPIGLAAGFDKDGDAIDGLFDIGFGYVEIGSITPEPQPGNPQPRVFKLPSTNSIINRYGFNSEGHFSVLSKLRNRILSFLEDNKYNLLTSNSSSANVLNKYENLNQIQSSHPDGSYNRLIIPNESNRSDYLDDSSIDTKLSKISDELDLQKSLRKGKVLAINLGKNKYSPPDSIEDFKVGIQRFGNFADVLVINISSPNTPGLRDLQSKDMLEEVLNEVVQTRDGLKSDGNDLRVPPILVKVAPDLSVEELVDISEVAQTSKIDGIIVSNTTTSRPNGSGTETNHLKESGGLSGPPLKPLSLRALSIIYSRTEGKIPLIGCGGISNAQDVLDYGKAGASFVQLYSSLIYNGIGLPRKLKDELVELLNDQRWIEVVGSEVPKTFDGGLTIDQLIENDKRRKEELKKAEENKSFEEKVKDIRGGIKFIEDRLKDFNDRSNKTDQSLKLERGKGEKEEELIIVREIKKVNEQDGFREGGSIINGKTKNDPQVGEEEPRGILLGWKNKRKFEKDHQNFQRLV